MRNPLNKRHFRQVRNNAGKYLGLFAMLLVAVAFTGGFLLAANSMEHILNEMDEKYRIEDGRFVSDFHINEAVITNVENLGVDIYADFYRQVPLKLSGADTRSDGIKARLYNNRTEVNLPAYAQGRAPEAANEVALDRVFMANHNLHIGDTVQLEGKDFEVVGICTLPDYQALFENNTDLVHNAITFTVGQVTPEGLQTLNPNSEVYSYSFVFDDENLDLAQRTKLEELMLDELADSGSVISSFIDVDDNSGIGFAIDDIQADRTVFTVVLFLLIIIMAFIFTILTGATIESESAVIATMLASGWRKGELIRHYLFLPAIIGFASVVLGLIIGVTVLADPLKNLYYNSYSIPPYELHWDASIVFFTTVLPFAILIGVTVVGLARKLRFTPLQFFRKEFVSRRRNATLPLPDALGYSTRFRLRVLLRNSSHFVTLFFGIAFANLLLLFGVSLMPIVENYSIAMSEAIPPEYQYVLKAPMELEGTPHERNMYAAALRLLEDPQRLKDRDKIFDATRRLAENDKLWDAIQRISRNDALLDALDRLQNNDAVMQAVHRAQTGQSTQADMALLGALDDVTQADIDLIVNLDEVTRADVDQLRTIDAATRADINLLRELDSDLLDDVRLASEIDEDAHLVNTANNSVDAIAQAEKFAIGSVEIKRAMSDKLETVTVYGIQPGSRYWTDIPVADGVVYASKGCIEKTIAELGASVQAVNRREGESYSIHVDRSSSNEADVSLYMSLHDFNNLFHKEASYFNAYASNEKLILDERYVARTITPGDMDKVSVQMQDSMSSFSTMVLFMAIPIYLVLVYLLTKTVIDRSARSISYMKVFGYRNREVNALYVRPITYWTLCSLVLSLPLVMLVILGMLKVAFARFSGNFPLIVPVERLALLVVVGMVTYTGVAFLHIRRIKRVPVELALKIQE